MQCDVTSARIKELMGAVIVVHRVHSQKYTCLIINYENLSSKFSDCAL